MGKAVNWDAVPDSNVVPDGTYLVSIAEINEQQSKSGKLMYNARLEIVEPEDFAGMGVFEYFVIGSDEDPDGDQEATWIKSIGARRIKNLFKAAQVPMDSDMDNIIAAALQAQLVISVSQNIETEGDYKGRVSNRIGAFYPLGSREVGVAQGEAPAQKKPLQAVPKAAAPAAAAAPKPAPKPAAAPAAKAPAAPAPKPNIPPGVQAPKPAPAAATKPAAQKPVHCTICDADVPRSEFADHVEAHANE